MSEDTLFPPYIARPEEEQIRYQLDQVREEGSSLAVSVRPTLYGRWRERASMMRQRHGLAQ
jgi:hypothetical protein